MSTIGWFWPVYDPVTLCTRTLIQNTQHSMQILKRTGQPDLHHELDDHTIVHIPQKYLNLHCIHPATCAAQALHFAARHDGIACHEA